MHFEQLRTGTSNDNNLIPMINVVFLLLVFFMVAGTLRVSDPVNVAPVESLQQRPLTLPLNLYMSADGALMLDGAVISAELLPSALAMNSDNTVVSDTKQSLALKVDAQVSVMQLRSLLGSLRDAGIREVELVTNWVPAPASSP